MEIVINTLMIVGIVIGMLCVLQLADWMVLGVWKLQSYIGRRKRQKLEIQK